MGSPLSSDFLRKRGTCCGSNCLHCPYGTTLRNIGIKFIAPDALASEILNSLKDKLLPSQVTSNLLGEAFGKTPNNSEADLVVLSLKDIPCGLAYINNGKLETFYLLPEFSDQGINANYLSGLI